MNEDQAIALLKKYSGNEESFQIVLKHSQVVMGIASRFANQIPNADKEIIRIGSLLHDIGRFRCPPGPKTIFHGVEGAKILRDEGLETYARIAERHLGAGISKSDIEEQDLPLPKQDFLPETIEEKIITYADNLVAGEEEKDINFAIERFRKEVGDKVAKRLEALHEELKSLQSS